MTRLDLAGLSTCCQRGTPDGTAHWQVCTKHGRSLQQDVSALMRRHLRHEERQVLTLRFGLEDGAPRTIRQVPPLGARERRVRWIASGVRRHGSTWHLAP